MINESTISEGDSKKNAELPLPEPNTALSLQNESKINYNGETSPEESTPHQPEQSVSLDNLDKANADDDPVDPPCEQKSSSCDKLSNQESVANSILTGDIVDLSSSDEEEERIKKSVNDLLEIRSNASSDLYIVEEDKEKLSSVIRKSLVNKESSHDVEKIESLKEGDKSSQEDGNNSPTNNEDNDAESHQSNEDGLSAIQPESHDTSEKEESNDGGDRDTETRNEVTEETNLVDTEKAAVLQLDEESNNVEAVTDEVQSEEGVVDQVVGGNKVTDTSSTADQEANDVGGDDVSLVGDEVVMEVDEVEQDDDVDDLMITAPSDVVVNNKADGCDKPLTEAMEVEEPSNVETSENNVQDVDNIETITGDRSLSAEAVLKNPDVTVCILSNSSSEKRPDDDSISDKDGKTKEDSNKPTTSTDKSATSQPSSGDSDANSPLETTSTQDATPSPLVSAKAQKKMKTLKVLYPKKKLLSGELDVVTVAPALRDCLQCAKFTTCTTKVAISGIDCYLCSKECINEQKLLHKKAVAVGSVVLPASADGSSDTSAIDITSLSNINIIASAQDELDEENTETVATRLCTACSKEIRPEKSTEGDLDGGTLQWATMDFCSEECLAKYQAITGSNCQLCGADVTAMSMGKYSVRFGYETRQFCTSTCLEEFKKGLKACSYCQRDLNSDGNDESVGFLAPVGEKGQFKDFCSEDCLEKYHSMSHNLPVQLTAHECAVCKKIKIVRLEVMTSEKTVKLCSHVCYAAFKFVNDKMKISVCNMCKKYFDVAAFSEQIMFYEDHAMRFCSKTCLNVHVLSKRKICPCSWCKVKKYNFDMIRKKMNNNIVYMCSLNCLALYQVSLRATIGKQKLKCDWCGKTEKANFHLTMSDASLRNFCSFECVDKFRGQYKVGGPSAPAATTTSSSLIIGDGVVVSTTNTATTSLAIPQTSTSTSSNTASSSSIDLPIISGVHSLQKYDNALLPRSHVKIVPKAAVAVAPTSQQTSAPTPPQPPPVLTVTQAQTVPEVLVRPKSPILMKNKITYVRVRRATKGTSCRPNKVHRCIQTEEDEERQGCETNENKVIIPVPVPIYVPTPLAMYSIPVPTLIPVPIPVPVPVFVPTSRSLAKDILEDIKKIQETFPRNPYEAELLTMAEAAAEKPSKSRVQTNGIEEGSNRFSGEEEDIDEDGSESRPARFVPCEALSVMDDSSSCGGEGKTWRQQSPGADARDPLGSPGTGDDSLDVDMEQSHHNLVIDDGNDTTNSCDIQRDGISVRKRTADSSPSKLGVATAKRKKSDDDSKITDTLTSSDKPHDHMMLKYTLGVNAWKYFANHYNDDAKMKKDGEEGKALNGQPQLLSTDLLEMRHEELNQALTLLMKEGKLPNGESYSPDTKFYLALGIQYYLLNNGRVDNIFSDPAYESFTDQLDNEARLFQETAASGNSIVTRVQEEHLWESRQLGVHSPHVLLSTLMYLNTKHFHLETVEEHLQLSFSQILKQNRRITSSPSASAVTGVNDEENRNNEGEADDSGSSCIRSSRSVCLRFYPPQTMLDANPKKKKLYEHYENEEHPSRCPVRLYEFYLSRCPESAKSRNDVFYLQPERSCAPDSPVWYTSTPLPDSLLKKMLNRIKMVKEINMAFVSQ